ncbi:MAG: response regulator [Chloroflexi bacterium]|nr:response regulator [Chloroflexota bacterium]
MSNIRVLVVDESRYTRDIVVQNVLKPKGFAVLEAMDGVTGLELALHYDVECIILALEMARMSGFSFIDSLRGHGIDVPIIAMTSDLTDTTASQLFFRDVHHCVTKPFTADDLLATVHRALSHVTLKHEKHELAEQLEQLNRQLEQRLRERDILRHIGESAAAQLGPGELLNQIADAALHLTGAEECTVFLADGTGKDLKRHLHKQHVKSGERQVSKYTEDQLAAAAMLRGEPTLAGPMLFVPIRVGDRSVGALGVSNSLTARPFSIQDQYPLSALASFAALALENARLSHYIRDAQGGDTQKLRSLLERYVSPSIVERLIANPETLTLGGVRRRATILFADIRGFSRFSVRAAPEVLVDVLNRHIAAASDAILAEGGTLDKFLGDAVMAYFNAPLPQPDHTLRAVRAAWRMCQAAQQSHSQLPSASRLEFGVGISTGEVLVGNIGVPQMMNFTVIGDAVNVSRRLQEHAKGGQILINVQAYESVRGYVNVRPIGMLEIKGHPQPEPIFEIVNVRL